MSYSVIRQRDVNVNLLDYANKNRDQGFFSDVTILAGNQTIPANRLELSCHSTYLEGMFKFQERNFTTENIIEIKTVNGEALKALIDFIYTGSITISDQNVKDLLSAAHYLQMNEVQQFCFEFLRYNITVDNSLNLLKIAGQYKNEGLIKEIQQYISINLDKVLQTDDFKHLSNEELVSCISKLDRIQTKESSMFKAIVAWINHENEARKTHFSALFKLINLAKITPEYLIEIVLEETLVTNSTDCYKLALKACHNNVIHLSKDQTAKSANQELVSKDSTPMTTHPKLVKENMSDPTSKLICLGGITNSCKVIVGYT